MFNDPFFYSLLVVFGYVAWRERNMWRFRKWVEHTVRRIDARTKRLERQHDMAQDVVSAALKGDQALLITCIERLREEFDNERGVRRSDLG